MRTTEEATLDESVPLETLREVLQEHPVKLAILFGSHAQGETHAGSDLDIAVVLETVRPADPDYNDIFFGLSADLSATLETDNIDLVDLQTASPDLVESIFTQGVLLIGEPEDVAANRNQLRPAESSDRSPRERFDAALERIDKHLGSSAVTATDGETRDR
ncbi:type VII toxin-antitoxin system MntA family adenylyltransferase antitoxin [Halostagnicola kamekurae]|uniref:Predicted nucleotidyltransferase n=1 Tax=Halostagnicola kamekurae TaxID=619731 RepID=A0A1I6V4A0_9EURY|nr:nucleotidyltransferase domain-containing protein [Halostagnicola kamekurae]SFT08525.1 Predicted nucleotidyltransferase [Halostagnicola kamekurae]